MCDPAAHLGGDTVRNEWLKAAEEKLWALEVLAKGYTIYSPCAAVYTYLKPLTSRENYVKNGRELVEIWKRTGVRLGFARKGLGGGLIDLAGALVLSVPRAAARAVVDEYWRTAVRTDSMREGLSRRRVDDAPVPEARSSAVTPRRG